MNNAQKIKNVSERSERTNSFSDFQNFGNEFYSEKSKQTDYKNRLYNMVLYGTSSFNKKELTKMKPSKVKHIENLNRQAQLELNLLKQERLIAFTNKIFGIFTNSKLAHDLIDMYSEPSGYSYQVNKLHVKDLKIAKSDIEERLIEAGVLPESYQLSI